MTINAPAGVSTSYGTNRVIPPARRSLEASANSSAVTT